MGLLGLIHRHNGSVQAILDDDRQSKGARSTVCPLYPRLYWRNGVRDFLISTLVGEEAILDVSAP